MHRPRCLQDAKEMLYRLFRAGFVGMQEIPRTADHAPSRTLYTWRVDAAAAAEKLAADLYRAALNVRLRLEYELNQQSNVSQLCYVTTTGSDLACLQCSILTIKQPSIQLVHAGHLLLRCVLTH